MWLSRILLYSLCIKNFQRLRIWSVKRNFLTSILKVLFSMPLNTLPLLHYEKGYVGLLLIDLLHSISYFVSLSLTSSLIHTRYQANSYSLFNLSTDGTLLYPITWSIILLLPLLGPFLFLLSFSDRITRIEQNILSDSNVTNLQKAAILFLTPFFIHFLFLSSFLLQLYSEVQVLLLSVCNWCKTH